MWPIFITTSCFSDVTQNPTLRCDRILSKVLIGKFLGGSRLSTCVNRTPARWLWGLEFRFKDCPAGKAPAVKWIALNVEPFTSGMAELDWFESDPFADARVARLPSAAIDSKMSSKDPTDLLRLRSSFPPFGIELPSPTASPLWRGAVSETDCKAMSACTGIVEGCSWRNAATVDSREDEVILMMMTMMMMM